MSRLLLPMLVCVTTLAAAPMRGDANPRKKPQRANPNGCELAAVKRRIAELLGMDPFVPGSAVVVLVSVERRGTGFAATLDITDTAGAMNRGGTRVLSAESCAELQSSLAVVIALVLRSHAAPPRAGSPDGETNVPVVAEPPVETRPPTEAAPPAAPSIGTGRASNGLRVEGAAIARPAADRPAPIALMLGGATGHAGGWRGELRAGARLQRSWQSLGLELHLSPAQEIAVADSAGAIAVRTTVVSLAPCAHVGHIALCGMVVGGWIHGSGQQLFEARDASQPLAAVGGQIAWEHSLGAGVAARAFADVRENVTTTTFQVDHMAVWSNPRTEGWLGLGLVAEIP